MFDWFKRTGSGSGGMDAITSDFSAMLKSGRRCFDLATNALLSNIDPQSIREELFITDQKINEWEQRIRRHLVVHVSVHGTTVMPASLVLMATVKDAERIGDYAKNIFDLTIRAAALKAESVAHAHLTELHARISKALDRTRTMVDAQDEDGARALVRELAAIEDLCDEKVEATISQETSHPCPATVVLAYRYFKRVSSHAMNVTTSVFMPLDKIDYFDEDPRPDVD